MKRDAKDLSKQRTAEARKQNVNHIKADLRQGMREADADDGIFEDEDDQEYDRFSGQFVAKLRKISEEDKNQASKMEFVWTMRNLNAYLAVNNIKMKKEM